MYLISKQERTLRCSYIKSWRGVRKERDTYEETSCYSTAKTGRSGSDDSVRFRLSKGKEYTDASTTPNHRPAQKEPRASSPAQRGSPDRCLSRGSGVL